MASSETDRSSDGTDSEERTDDEVSDALDELELEDLKRELEDCFSSVESKGSFSHNGSCGQNFLNPGLKVTGIGTVGLPLSGRDAALIKDFSHQAPFGKGEQTVVDESIRKTWEINADQVELANPKWSEWFNETVVRKVAEELGIEPDATKYIKADLYKLLLYEPDAMFKPHQDSEKAPQMFATLVVSLPSQHEGGDLVMQFGGKTRTWKSSLTSAFDLSYGAWYADVTHEVTPVTSGHRLMLTYNLINSNPTESPASASNLLSSDIELQKVLSRWRKADITTGDSGDVDFLCYILDHEYTAANLRLSGLKGQDRQTVRQAARAASESDFTVYLATFEKTGSYDYDGEKEDEECELCKVVDLEGNSIAEHVFFEEELLVPANPFEDEEPDKEDEDYTGNEGVPSGFWYYRTVMVLIPSERAVKFTMQSVLSGRNDITPFASGLLERYLQEPGDGSRLRDVRALVKQVTEHEVAKRNDEFSRTHRFSPANLGHVVACCACTDDWEHFAAIVNVMKDPLPLAAFKDIGASIRQPAFPHFKEGLAKAIDRLNTIPARLEALENLGVGIELQAPKCKNRDYHDMVEEWAKIMLDRIIQSQQPEASGTSSSLLDMAKRFGTDILIKSVFPYATAHAEATPFAVEFLVEINKRKHELVPNSLEGLTQELWGKVFNRTLDCFQSAKVFEHKEPSAYWSYAPRFNSKKMLIDSHVDGGDVAALYGEASKSVKNTEAQRLLSKFVQSAVDAGKQESSVYPKMVLPFLHELVAILKKQGVSLESVRESFLAAVDGYLRDWVELEPRPPPDWSLPRLEACENCRDHYGSDCGDCELVNAFLTSPTQREMHFKAAERRRTHIHFRLHDLRHEVNEQTIKSGRTPYTLLLTKTGTGWKKDLPSWQGRAATASEEFRKFPEHDLRQLLRERYEEITTLRALRAAVAATQSGLQPRPPLQALRQSTNTGNTAALSGTYQPRDYPAKRLDTDMAPPMSGNGNFVVPAKRKAEIVDLTGD